MLSKRFSRQALSRRHLVGLSVGLGAGVAASGRSWPASAWQATPEMDEEGTAIVGDVVDFSLTPEDRWPGPFSSVTLQLHPAYHDGGEAWFIRTDASDEAFASEEGLVYVPLLQNALEAEGSFANLYRFDGGVEDQRTVISTVPDRDDYTSAFRIHNVTFNGEPELLDSVDAIMAAEEAGTITVEQTDIIVNYPLVVWPDGGLPVDPDLEMALGPGPLVEEPDIANGVVTFKLHQCYPGSRYIATDTSAAPMAPMMGVVGSAPTQALIDAGATAPIYVFGNGFAGPGPMGFQPSIFNTSAGDPAWSPFWEHFVVMWTDESAATVITNEADLLAAVDAGDLELFNGTPDTHPEGFVVNCPSPVLATNTYDPADFG